MIIGRSSSCPLCCVMCQVSVLDTPNIIGKGQEDSMTLRSEVAVSTILKEIQQRNWLLVHDCHGKILSSNVIKKMTLSITPDLNVYRACYVVCHIHNMASYGYQRSPDILLVSH
jgi:hypothetical protein